jgi:hypothetical protein
MMQRRIDGEQMLQNVIGEEFRYVTPYIAGKGGHGGRAQRIILGIRTQPKTCQCTSKWREKIDEELITHVEIIQNARRGMRPI